MAEKYEERVPVECCMTTTDNPYNPFDNYIEWSLFDIQHGYQTSERVARLARTSDELSDEDNAMAIEDAIDFLIAHCPVTFADGTPLYKKVTRPMSDAE